MRQERARVVLSCLTRAAISSPSPTKCPVLCLWSRAVLCYHDYICLVVSLLPCRFENREMVFKICCALFPFDNRRWSSNLSWYVLVSHSGPKSGVKFEDSKKDFWSSEGRMASNLPTKQVLGVPTVFRTHSQILYIIYQHVITVRFLAGGGKCKAENSPLINFEAGHAINVLFLPASCHLIRQSTHDVHACVKPLWVTCSWMHEWAAWKSIVLEEMSDVRYIHTCSFTHMQDITGSRQDIQASRNQHESCMVFTFKGFFLPELGCVCVCELSLHFLSGCC